MKDLVYLCGPPGAGKSTLMAELTAPVTRIYRGKPFGHQVLTGRDGELLGVELGTPRDRFPGTDTLSMSVAPKAAAWMRETTALPLLLGEGDRLSHMGFLEAAESARFKVHLVYVYADVRILDRRCEERGSTQDPSWRAGRATKAARLRDSARAHGYHVVEAHTVVPVSRLAAALREELPVLGSLWA